MSILVLLIISSAVAIFLTKKNKKPTDYYVLFIIGLIWLIVGIPLDNYPLFIIGLVLMAIGAVNRDKWDKNHA